MANEQLQSAMACSRDIPNGKPSALQDCTDVVNISIFFDGTGNNNDVDEASKKWSNVARMFQAAELKNFTATGVKLPNHNFYISGVGTPYLTSDKAVKAVKWQDEVQIKLAPLPLMIYDALPDTAHIAIEDHVGGQLGGAGGTRRTELGQRNVNDALYNALLDNAKKMGGTIKAYAEKSSGQSFGELNKALKAHRLIKVINLSVFGFSRGAALARAFVNDFLTEKNGCKKNEKGQWTCGGVPLRLHFMGIFDTVASFGVPSLNIDTPFNERNLVVPGAVERCVHLVAAHEVRFSFPVDLIRQHGRLMPNWREEAVPGVHSDVGGGYVPVDQGVTNNYSRIPMREMMREAVIHGVRMLSYYEVEGVDADLFDKRFAILPKTQADYDRYIAAVKSSPSDPMEKQVAAHMKALYSGCGTLHRKGMDVPHDRVTRGSLNPATHESMADEVNRYRGALSPEQRRQQVAFPVYFVGRQFAQLVSIDPWRLAAWDTPASDAVTKFIGSYVHDSKVGFLSGVEPFSYFRPRGMAEATRNVLARGMQWVDDAASAVAANVIKVYYQAGAVLVETWKAGKLIATKTYKVGEKFAVETVQAGERYAVEVYQTSRQVTIMALQAGHKFIVDSVDAAQEAAAVALKAARDTAQKAANAAAQAASGAANAVQQTAAHAADAAQKTASAVAGELSRAASQGLKAVEDAWNAAKKLEFIEN